MERATARSSRIGVGSSRLKLLQYLFLRYGKWIVFVGRFVMILRAWEAFLAGADWMPWRTFALTYAAAVIVWSCVWGLSSYALGHASASTIEWISAGVGIVIVGLLISCWIYFRRHEEELGASAEQASPGLLRPGRHDPRELAHQ